MDLNTFYSNSKFIRNRFKLLLSAIALFANRKAIKRTFGLVDTQKPAIEKFYVEQILMEHALEYQPVAFDTYTYGDTGNPVYWRVLEWKQEGFLRALDNANRCIRYDKL